jgi:hypothetical protein
MKKTCQFLPLLKQMLGFHRYGPLPLLIYIAVTAAVLLVSSVFFPIGWMEAHARQTSWGQELVWSCLMCWYFLGLISTPLPFQLSGGITSLEFLFTRAIDRGLYARAGRTATIIFGLGPVILNVVLSPLGPELAFEPAAPGSPAAAIQERYMRAFPGSRLSTDGSPGKAEQLVIRHGSEAFAAWLLWIGLVSVFLVAAYFSVVFAAWQRAGWHHSKSRWQPWLGGIMVNGPLYLPILLLIICAALRIDVFEESFLLFAGHPVLMVVALIALILIVQPFSERELRKLEFF